MAVTLVRGKGQQIVRSFPVDSTTVIAIGDLVFLDTDDLKPAASFTWNTNIATTQGDFAAKFAGVALTASASGETDPVQVDIGPACVYEMDIASATPVQGDSYGPAKASGNALENQKLVSATATSCIARIAKRYTAATTRVEVTFASAYYTGSSNINANVG